MWARDWLQEHGMPDPKAEPWRYTPLGDIIGAFSATSVEPPPESKSESIDPAALDLIVGRHGSPRLVFVDGRHAPELSDADRPAGLWVGPLADAPDPRGVASWSVPGPDGPEPSDGFSVLNAAAEHDTAVVLVSPDTAVESPIHLVHLRRAGDDLATHPATVIDVGPGASCRVVESYVSIQGGISNAATQIRIGADARLAHVRLQAEAADTIHVGNTEIYQQEGSTLESTSLSLGAHIARNALTVRFAGPGATADLNGLSLLGNTQRHDTVITVDHAVPNCTSTQRFHVVVDDHGHSSFSGHVIVQHGADGTDASQSNRNLLLSRTTQADTRPWLEIFADDVRCNHGATVGRLDDDALFYLRSRGVPAAKAAAMLVVAFATEIIEGLAPASLHEVLDSAIAALDPGGER